MPRWLLTADTPHYSILTVIQFLILGLLLGITVADWQRVPCAPAEQRP